jgi:predicted Zn finger-like uncharacterized protein
MSLATRCDACGTIFRVVRDQLKVSDGWVRCGRCHTVFDAQRGLFDLDRDTPPPWSPPAMPGLVGQTSDTSSAPGLSKLIMDEAPWPGDAQPTTRDVDLSTLRADDLQEDEARVVEPIGTAATEGVVDASVALLTEPDELITNGSRSSSMSRLGGDTTGDRVDPADRNEFANAEFPLSMLQEDGQDEGRPHATTKLGMQPELAEDRPAAPPPDTAAKRSSRPPHQHTTEDSSTPEFVRRARRIERWQSTESRVALSFVTVVAALALAWQTGHHFRQHIAAQWPEATPFVARYCGVVGCSVQALRRIDDVSIETTSLNEGDAGLGSLRLSVTLRNRAEVPVAMPSVDLSLTGADGELVARRALFPADFRTGNLPLKPGVDTSLLLNFSVTGSKVSGYTVEVFYP